MLKPHGVGIVGYGRFGQMLHEAWGDAVIAVQDRLPVDPGTGVTIHPSLSALLEDPTVDIVAVATEPRTHAAIASDALCANKHVIVEKPVAIDLDGVRTMDEIASRRGLVVTVDHVLIAHPLVSAALALARSGLVGRPVSFGVTNYAACDHLGPEHWFWDSTRSGGILVEHGVHFFDLALRLLGPTQQTWGTPVGDRKNGAGASVRHAHGVSNHVHVFSRTRASESTSIEVGYEKATLRLDGWVPLSGRIVGEVHGTESLFPNATTEVCIDPPARRVAFHMNEDKATVYRDCLRRVLMWTVKAIEEGIPPPVDLDHARRALHTALDCRGGIR